jgi:putative transposase
MVGEIVGILNDVDVGLPVGGVVRRYGINITTHYKWKSKYAGLDASEL